MSGMVTITSALALLTMYFILDAILPDVPSSEPAPAPTTRKCVFVSKARTTPRPARKTTSTTALAATATTSTTNLEAPVTTSTTNLEATVTTSTTNLEATEITSTTNLEATVTTSTTNLEATVTTSSTILEATENPAATTLEATENPSATTLEAIVTTTGTISEATTSTDGRRYMYRVSPDLRRDWQRQRLLNEFEPCPEGEVRVKCGDPCDHIITCSMWDSQTLLTRRCRRAREGHRCGGRYVCNCEGNVPSDNVPSDNVQEYRFIRVEVGGACVSVDVCDRLGPGHI